MSKSKSILSSKTLSRNYSQYIVKTDGNEVNETNEYKTGMTIINLLINICRV